VETIFVNGSGIHTDWKAICTSNAGECTVRNVGSAVLVFSAVLLTSLLTLTTNSFAAPHVMRASTVPEPGVLVALGGGLVGLAAVIRRRVGR
jgi:PEP-CTERM motif